MVTLFRESHINAEEHTRHTFPKQISLIEDGIDLLLTAEEILGDRKLVGVTPELATRSMLFRFQMSIPSTAFMSFQVAAKGQYRISLSIMRTLIEEVVSVKYYTDDYKRAFDLANQVVPYEAKMSKKFKDTGLEKSHRLYQLYDSISEVATHANTLKGLYKARREGNRNVIRADEPMFDAEKFRDIAGDLCMLIGISHTYFGKAFVELDKSGEFNSRYEKFSETFETLYPQYFAEARSKDSSGDPGRTSHSDNT